MITRAYKEFDEAKTPFLPIKLETLSTLISHCFEVIEKYAEDILFAYEIFWPVITGKIENAAAKFDWHHALEKFEQRQTSLWNMEQYVDPDMKMPWRVAMGLRQTIMRHPDWESSSYYRTPTNLYRTPIYIVREIASTLSIDVRGSNKAVQYDVTRVRREVMSMATNLRNACASIILLVTGMRRSELAKLKIGNYWEVPGPPGIYRLRYIVFKTSEGSQGDEHEIPIPRIAYQSLCLLERLTKPAREFGQTNLLFTSVTINFGKPLGLSSINAFFIYWCENLGLGEMIHPHQFRKTLAMFLIYQDSGNLPLIKRLFSHKSLRMSLAYITKLPGIAQEVKLILLEQNRALMSELLQAASKGVISGAAGLRIKENARSGKYSAMLHDDGWETIEQYIDSLLDEGAALLHRAALGVICTKTPAIDQPASCDPPFAKELKRLHPNIQNCDPFDCKFAVFTESSVQKLVNDVKAHEAWSTHPYAREDQKQFSQRRISDSVAKLLELGFDKEGARLSTDFDERVA
jgi:integrase